MPIEEITATAKRLKKRGASVARAPATGGGGSTFDRLMREGPTDFQRLMRQPVNPREEIIEEVVATAKRIPKPPSYLGRLLGPLSAATSVAEIGAMIADQISQQRLDEAGQIATSEVFAKPDTPVQTIEEAPIPEIVVTASRSSAPARPTFNFPTARASSGAQSFGELLQMPSVLYAPRPVPMQDIEIAAPDISKLRVASAAVPAAFLAGLTALGSKLARKTKTAPGRRPPGGDLPTIFADPQLMAAPLPVPNPLTDFTSPPKIRPTALTEFEPRLVQFRVPRTQTQRAAFCPPCPKGTETKKKRRECWKKLVQERADPRLDKVYKWERIDCRTGRPIKRKR